jgi:exopolyphosphatase/guanosine-5'-triphosphate,3'-diphosphate pyrophosphatase
MRLAAIDIGTNSIHMIVVRVREDLSFEVVDREKSMVRLGAGGLDGKALTAEATTGALRALSTFKRIADSHKVDTILAAATSATREAPNGGEFLARIESETGIRPRVIAGPEEARLIHMAATYGVDVGASRAVVVDIGGGSVELTLGDAASLKLARSVKLGVIRLTERFVKSDPLSKKDERRLVKHVRSGVDGICRQIAAAGFDRVIGTSGTILSIGTVASAAARGVVPSEIRNLRVPVKAIRRLRRAVVDMTVKERLALPGLDPRRADLTVAGAVLLDTILQRLGADDLTLCDLALREGLVLDYIRRHQKEIAHIEQIPDVRRRSVLELAERCNYYAEHAQHVAHLSLALFDQSRALHGLGDREREWLEYAALMHDIGAHISFGKHHRHSYYLITNGDLRGFQPDEIEVIALVARYHRRGTPKASHEEYARLASGRRRTVRVLSSMLRVAESLDRSHSQVIANLTVRARADEVRVDVQAAGDAELELWATSRQMEPFEAVVGCRVRLTLDSRIRPPAAPAGKTAKAARSSRPAKAARPRATARG